MSRIPVLRDDEWPGPVYRGRAHHEKPVAKWSDLPSVRRTIGLQLQRQSMTIAAMLRFQKEWLLDAAADIAMANGQAADQLYSDVIDEAYKNDGVVDRLRALGHDVTDEERDWLSAIPF